MYAKIALNSRAFANVRERSTGRGEKPPGRGEKPPGRGFPSRKRTLILTLVRERCSRTALYVNTSGGGKVVLENTENREQNL